MRIARFKNFQKIHIPTQIPLLHQSGPAHLFFHGACIKVRNDLTFPASCCVIKL